ncbi:MAG: serine/threonine protein kinase [Blautia sp.]|nr:serine/threonine protein kinase [Blautia sp.]
MNINGYILDGELRTTNGANCRWGFAHRDGRRYFVKELLSPVYPTAETPLEERIKERKREGCRKFARRQALLYRTINECSDGTLVHIEEFFRYGSHYYITMPAVESYPEEMMRSAAFSPDDRYRVSRILIFGMARLHSAGLIHGDLKLSNVLLTRSPGGNVTARIIDFEDCFFSEESPKPGESIRADQRYMAPETFRLMTGEQERLTQAIDVFSLGLMIHEILTGRFPKYDGEYDYPFEAVLSGSPLMILKKRLPEPFDSLLPRMLVSEPEGRISLEEAKMYFSDIRPMEERGQTGEKDFFSRAGNL